MLDYRDLDVWQLAMRLAKQVYTSTASMPKEELFGMTSQIRRAAVSIPANIAEGAGRNGRGEYVQFLGYANGSQTELSTLLFLAEQIYPAMSFRSELETAARIGMMLTKLKRSLRSRTSQG